MEARLRLLLVDDDATYRDVAKELIEQLGHDCTVAENGHDALELYERIKPDAVLMDIIMPGMNGMEATLAILSKYAHAQVVFLSSLEAFPEGAPREIADQLEVRGKPWTLDAMREILKTLEPRPAQQQVG